MPAILVDANIEGQGAHIWMRMQSSQWREFTTALDLSFQTFREVGLNQDSTDAIVWRFCQQKSLYLLTSNRNEDSETSLQTTLRREGTAESLPVFTLPFADRVYSSQAFLDRVVEKLLDYLLDPHNIVGTGRLYLP